MSTDQTIRAQGYQYFLQEAPELLQILEQGLLTLQEDSSINKVNTLMRATHTLKGAAASLELATIAKVAHSLEDVFRALCRPEVAIDAEVEALLFEGFECLRSALRAELTEATIKEDEILNRTATIFAQLQDHLGDCFDQDAPIPTSAELGFDVTQSIFEVGVAQRLEQLAAILATDPMPTIQTTLQTQAEVFLGLGESLNLPGFGAIAQAAIAALQQHPDQVRAIAQLALADLQAGHTAVLAGDRSQGGQPSAALQALAQIPVGESDREALGLRSVDDAMAVWEDVENAADFNDAAAYDEFPMAATPSSMTDDETSEMLEPSGMPSIQKLLQWMRKPAEAPSDETFDEGASDLPERSDATATQDQTAAIAVDEVGQPEAADTTVTAGEQVTEAIDGSEWLEAIATDMTVEATTAEESATATDEASHDDQALGQDAALNGSAHFDEGDFVDAFAAEADSPLDLTQAIEGGALVEDIWGAAAGSSADAMRAADATMADDPSLAVEASNDQSSDNQAPENLPSDSHPSDNPPSDTPPSDPEAGAVALTVSTYALNSPANRQSTTLAIHSSEESPGPSPRSTVQQPTSLSPKGLTSPAPTVRVQVEHLDQLNYAVGELLTNHNQQSLQAEQTQQAMRHLYARLQKHQHLLSQLQDWIDYPPISQDHDQKGDRAPGSVAASFRANPSANGAAERSTHSLPSNFDALELEQFSEPQLVIQALLDDTVQLTEAVDAVDLFARQSRQSQAKQGRLLLKTRDALIEGRMFPLGQLFERFAGVLQQLETLHRKPVDLTLRGTEVLVDKAIGERLYDPILHLVRNAFDHGIEPVEIRQQRAKPATGQLEIAAHHQGKHLVIEVRDDGQGLDFERIRQQAIARQLISPQQAQTLSQAQLTELLFEPGFSTASELSSLSGRGVGLDVVRNQLQALQGEVTVTSSAQQGTLFTLHIPLSLTIAKLLVCQAAARTYALLPDAIEQIIIPAADQVQQREHCKALWWGEDEAACLVPIYALADLLNYHEPAQQLPTSATVPFKAKTAMPHVLLIRHNDVLVGIEVEQMLGEQELVIRPLSALITTHDYIYGASILADGQLALVFDGATLTEAALAQYSGNQLNNRTAPTLTAAPAHAPSLAAASDSDSDSPSDAKLLIVDDSITTRQTLTLTLQKAGYQIIQAQDGQEALDQLQQHPHTELVICDVEMPRMNGFEFLQHCQRNPDLAATPVMMLSSRSSDKHRLLAEQLGAIAYISKPYLEHKLLEMVAEVISKSEADHSLSIAR